MARFIAPKVGESSFTCPICGVLASIKWSDKGIDKTGDFYFIYNVLPESEFIFSVSTCIACGNPHFWIDDKMVMPVSSGVPMPNEDMPDEVRELYLEAREVLPYSAKASIALLRLALQHLCKELGGEGKNINNDISKLVKEGLSVKVQKALDSIRVIGNNAVHPGTIDLDDNPDIAPLLFELLNVIVNEMITQPKQIDELYLRLPQRALDAISKRDS